MGIYLVKNYEKNKNGKFDLKSQKIDKAPHDVGRWQNKNGVDLSLVEIKPTKSGLNQKVVKSVNYFDNKQSKTVYSLLTTSSKLSKKDKEKYSKVKNVKYF